MQHKNFTVSVLCLALISGVLGGCGKKEGENGAENGSGEGARGRYVETQVDLPEQLDGWNIRQIFAAEDRIHLLAMKQESGKAILKEWEQQEDIFADVTQGWLAGVELPGDGSVMNLQLQQAADGTQYLLADYKTGDETEYKSHLWKGNGDTLQEITPQKWTVPNEEWGGYESVLGIAVLDDKTLAAVSGLSLDRLDGNDGSIQESESVYNVYDGIVTNGESIFLGSARGNGSSGFEIERRRDGQSQTLVLQKNGMGASYCALKDGTVIVAGADGIFRGTEDRDGKEGASWEKLADGTETDFALTQCWCTGLAALEDGRIYALFQESGGGAKLNKYEYDPEAVIAVTENLKLYTVFGNSLLEQAAAMYHREHPWVMITIQSVYPMYYYEETDYNAVYQELNTLLMSGDAPDILVMDHLNMDSYAEKGLLEDIDDVVGAMEEKGELLSNITGVYVREDGHRYAVPLQFGFTMAVGREITAGDMDSMENLAGFLGKQDYSYLGAHTVSELVDKFYPYFCGEIVNDGQLDREALGKYLEYLKEIGDNCGILPSRGRDEKCLNIWDLASEAKLSLTEVTGFRDSMLSMSIRDYIQGESAAFESSFIPSLQTGICTKSAYKETAKDFLRFALSETVQDTDYYKGFPVNAASLEKQACEDRSDAEAETDIEAGGSHVEFRILDFSRETAEQITAMCKSLDRPVGEDGKIREVLTEALEGYLTGGQSGERTVQRIEDGLKMYLAE